MALPVAPPGHLVWTEIAGTDGGDYSRYEMLGYTNIVRLNWSYGHGTIPDPAQYDEFAANCAAFVAHSQGCHTWIIGNEPNHSQERPPSGVITPEQYEACFVWCYGAIKAVRPDDLVLPAPIAPYNWESGDCLSYLGNLAELLVADGVLDGWVLHAYTRAHDPALITSELRVDNEHWHFRTYRDQAAVVAKHALDVPLFLTEANPTNGWTNVNNGWIREALCEIDTWNQGHPHQVIRAVCPFRWHDPSRPEWSIGDKAGVVEDYTQAAELGYSWDSWDNDEEEPVTEGQWREQYVNRCEGGFYDQGGKSEFTIPVGMQLYYLHDPVDPEKNNEPEMDAKDKALGHREVFEGRYSANGFYQFCSGTYWLVTDPIFVQNGRPVRGELMYMHVFDNSNGGGRAGITDGDGPFGGDFARPPEQREAIESAVNWGGWRGTYGGDGLPERQWVKLTAPEVMPTKGHVRLCVQFNSDNAGFGAGHFDVFRVEQFTDTAEPEPEPEPGPGPQPPVEGVLRVEIAGPGGGPIQVQQVSGGQGLIARIRAMFR